MKLKTYKTIFIILTLCLIASVAVYALTSWGGTIGWTLATETFEVYSVQTEGSPISPPYNFTESSPISTGIHTYHFWIENTGTVPITVEANVVGTPVGCTASWSSSSSYYVTVGSTRVQATLTLNVTATGSYGWTFDLA